MTTKGVSPGVRNVIIRLLTDDDFRKRFVKNARKTLAESGYALKKSEVEDLVKLDAKNLKLEIELNSGRMPPYGVIVKQPYAIGDKDEES
ncbi:MAG TPA: Os1348 family NHLP clan protein [Methanomassiliicoccales archaeon]|nr:Os1348 family NHLP clan protein [Methanomassiliicoccales archaeon]